MSITGCIGLVLLAATSVSGYTSAADNASARRPRVGEVRALAIALSEEDVIALHRGGWLEVRGQLLSTKAFPELFRSVGRTWTASEVPDDRFAIPEIRDRSQREMSSDNPFRVLGPADQVSGGIVNKPWLRRASLSYWIFVGRDVNTPDVVRESRP